MLALLGSSFAAAVAIVSFLCAVMVPPPPQPLPGRWLFRAGLLTVLALALSVRLGLAHQTLASMTAGAFALAAASVCIVLVRARGTGGDGGWGGGGPGDDEDPPAGPQGPVDWNRFEEEFWSYVDTRHATPAGLR